MKLAVADGIMVVTDGGAAEVHVYEPSVVVILWSFVS